jgi:cleavage and polyadenylation specificity factor subunit 1
MTEAVSRQELASIGATTNTDLAKQKEERVTQQDCPPPKTAGQLRRFLGMLNVYRQFLPHAAATQAPLHAAFSGPRVKSSHPIIWTPDLHKASLSRATLLAHPDPSAPLALVTDASTTAMGAVLQQRADNAWQPIIIFFSGKLNPAQQEYSAYDRELLAVYEAVKHFRHMLEARHFTIFTDHKPITYAFQQKRDKCSPRQFNHLDFIAQFSTDVRHILGQDNVVADALSRVESITAAPSHDALAASQESDGELRALLASDTALRLEKQQIPGTAVSIYCDTSAGKPRPYVRGPLRLQVFQSVHEFSPRHEGSSKTGRTALRVARHAEGLSHLGTGLPGLPAFQSLPPHSYSSA